MKPEELEHLRSFYAERIARKQGRTLTGAEQAELAAEQQVLAALGEKQPDVSSHRPSTPQGNPFRAQAEAGTQALIDEIFGQFLAQDGDTKLKPGRSTKKAEPRSEPKQRAASAALPWSAYWQACAASVGRRAQKEELDVTMPGGAHLQVAAGAISVSSEDLQRDLSACEAAILHAKVFWRGEFTCEGGTPEARRMLHEAAERHGVKFLNYEPEAAPPRARKVAQPQSHAL
jgi:hypothetical protein